MNEILMVKMLKMLMERILFYGSQVAPFRTVTHVQPMGIRLFEGIICPRGFLQNKISNFASKMQNFAS